MRLHAIVDFMYLYYKYWSTYDKGRLRRLITIANGEEVDVTLIYYPLKEIEGIRKLFDKDGHDVILSICMDSKSVRKEKDVDYKSNRQNRLSDLDYENINLIGQLLKDAGHNVFKIEGEEADDIIANLVNIYKEDFDLSVIYTPDSDALVNISKGVVVSRYKRGKHENIGLRNFSGYCSEEFKCYIPYNALLLHKVLCGDRTDAVKGIKGFGPKAFDKYIEWLGDKVDFSYLGNREACQEVILNSIGYLGEEAIAQALYALDLVCYRPINPELLTLRDILSTKEERENSYGRYDMKSLI